MSIALLLYQALTDVRKRCLQGSTHHNHLHCCRLPVVTCAAVPPVDIIHLHHAKSVRTILTSTTKVSNRSLHCVASRSVRLRSIDRTCDWLICNNLYSFAERKGVTAGTDGNVCTGEVTPSGRPSLCNPAALAL